MPKILTKRLDGGPQSTVTGYWLIEIKWLFSIAILKFAPGSRDNFHNHAFNSRSWLIRGRLNEHNLITSGVMRGCTIWRPYLPSWRPIKTLRETFHRVFSIGTSWVFTIRGPWHKTSQEYDPHTREIIILKHGRIEIERVPLSRARITP